MKGINKTMNHIVEEEKKDILAPHIEDSYKVIYPNNNLSIKLIRNIEMILGTLLEPQVI